MTIKVETKNRYINRLSDVKTFVMHTMQNVEVNKENKDLLLEFFHEAKRIEDDLFSTMADIGVISNDTGALERRVKVWKRNNLGVPFNESDDLSESVEIPTIAIVVDTGFTGSVQEMAAEIQRAQAMLMGVYSHACRTNALASQVPAFVSLKMTVDGLTETMRKVSALGNI